MSASNVCRAQVNQKDIIFEWEHSAAIAYSIDVGYKKFFPTVEEIQLAKQISINYIDSLEANRDPKTIRKQGHILKYSHDDYFRQYVGYIDGTGAKKIYINACCSALASDRNVLTDWFSVFGGGSCLFHAIIDLDHKKCIDFKVNSDM
jgi:hypothetical protein